MKRTRLRRVGKRALTDREELAESAPSVITRARGRCEVQGPTCTTWATDTPHHIRPRGAYFGLDRNQPSNLLAVCAPCHHQIHHVDPRWARANGFLA